MVSKRMRLIGMGRDGTGTGTGTGKGTGTISRKCLPDITYRVRSYLPCLGARNLRSTAWPGCFLSLSPAVLPSSPEAKQASSSEPKA